MLYRKFDYDYYDYYPCKFAIFFHARKVHLNLTITYCIFKQLMCLFICVVSRVNNVKSVHTFRCLDCKFYANQALRFSIQRKGKSQKNSSIFNIKVVNDFVRYSNG